jgi:predicted enzyme related to lactoylglutathione lyase
MISWFEIPADDLERAKKFYSELFGWKIERLSVPSGKDYMTINTGNVNAVRGSLIKRRESHQTTVNYIDVP